MLIAPRKQPKSNYYMEKVRKEGCWIRLERILMMLLVTMPYVKDFILACIGWKW